MSVMSGKKERRIINLQYRNGNSLLTKRVTDVFLWSQNSGLNYVARVNNRWARSFFFTTSRVKGWTKTNVWWVDVLTSIVWSE